MQLVRAINGDKMTNAERAQAMMAHVVAQEQSGKSRKAYCAQHGMREQVLYYWRAKRHAAGTRATAKGFAQVQVVGSAHMELHYPNGVRLLLPAGTALQEVAACIRLY